MDPNHKRLLRNYMVRFRDELNYDDIRAHLEEKKIFPTTGLRTIEGGGDRPDFKKVEQLMIDLPKRGPTAFSKFYLCLMQSGHEHLAELLEEGLAPNEIRRNVPVPQQEWDGSIRLQPVTGAAVKHPSDEVYSMIRYPRGPALIICVSKFDKHLDDLSERKGSERDVILMQTLLGELYFDVLEPVHDPTKHELWDSIRNFSDLCNSKGGECFALVLMSHGTEQDEIYTTDGEKVRIDHIQDRFTASSCRGFAGKPKLFIIQACRGVKIDQGHEVTDAAMVASPVAPRPQQVLPPSQHDSTVSLPPVPISDDVSDARRVARKVADPSDMYIAYSTAAKYSSWRNEIEGSWFIRDVARAFCERAHSQNIHDIFTRVNKLVQDRRSSRTDAVQIPSEESKLRKSLYFNPKYPANVPSHLDNNLPKLEEMSIK